MLVVHNSATSKVHTTNGSVTEPVDTRELEHDIGLLSSTVEVITFLDNEIAKHEDKLQAGNLSIDEVRSSMIEVDNTINRFYGYCGSGKTFISQGLLSSNLDINSYQGGVLGLKEYFTKAKEGFVNFFKKLWSKVKELWNKIFSSKEAASQVDSADKAIEEVKNGMDANSDDKISQVGEAAGKELAEQDPLQVAKDIAIFNLCVLNSGYAEMVEAVAKELEGQTISAGILEKKIEDINSQMRKIHQSDPRYAQLEEEKSKLNKQLFGITTRMNYTKESYEKNKDLFDKQDALERSLSNLYSRCTSNNLVLDKLGFEVDIEGLGVVKDAVLVPFGSKPFVIFKSPDGLHLKTVNFKIAYSNKSGVINTFKNGFIKLFGNKNEKDLLKKQVKVDKVISVMKNFSSKEGAEVIKNQEVIEKIINEVSGENADQTDRELVTALCKLQSSGAIDVATLSQGAVKETGRLTKLVNKFTSLWKKDSQGE